MKLPFGTVVLFCLSIGSPVALGITSLVHIEKPLEHDVESPEIIATSVPTASATISPTISPTTTQTTAPSTAPSTAPTTAPTIAPTTTPTTAPTVTPTNVPTTSPTASPTVSATLSPTNAPSPVPTFEPTKAPSDSPSNVLSTAPSQAPSASPTTSECTTSGGVFGDIDQEVFRTIEFGYELEANANVTEIESKIIPVVESAITNSVLGEIFTECSAEASRRRLRTSRRLDVTGVTQNPEDLILSDIICGSVGTGNECVVISGALSIYASDKESANAMHDFIKEAIKSKMSNGDFDDVSVDVVRVTYTDISKDTDGSETTDQDDSQVGNNSTGVLVGALVAAGVVVAAIGTIAYKRRQDGRESDDAAVATYFGEQTTFS